ncbi:hypothetical protein ACMFMG_011011 [Clarireedia jacksonii]
MPPTVDALLSSLQNSISTSEACAQTSTAYVADSASSSKHISATTSTTANTNFTSPKMKTRSKSSSKPASKCHKPQATTEKHRERIKKARKTYQQYITELEVDSGNDNTKSTVSTDMKFISSEIENSGSDQLAEAMMTASFSTSLGIIDGKAAVITLAENPILYAIKGEVFTSAEGPDIENGGYNDYEFYEIMIDTGTSKKSTVRKKQCDAYQRLTEFPSQDTQEDQET